MKDAWTTVFDAIRGHPDAVVACTALFAAVLMFALGVGPLAAGGIPALIFLLYYFRMASREMHAERMLELSVRQLEADEGAAARNKLRNAIEQRQRENGRP